MDLDLSDGQNAKIDNLSLDLLQTISDARNEHGLRSLDYTAYRSVFHREDDSLGNSTKGSKTTRDYL